MKDNWKGRPPKYNTSKWNLTIFREMIEKEFSQGLKQSPRNLLGEYERKVWNRGYQSGKEHDKSTTKYFLEQKDKEIKELKKELVSSELIRSNLMDQLDEYEDRK